MQLLAPACGFSMLSLRMLGLLIHMFLMSDVVSECPAELNPLSLDPPKVVKQYGEEAMLNCTSNVDIHEGMYWNNEFENPSRDEEATFVIQSVSLSNWNVTATCKIKLNKSLECSRDVEITVYKNPDMVILHPINPVNATVEGKEYELQCDIINVAPVQNVTVTWYKDNQIIMTNTFTNTTKTPVNESSILLVNMSRGENGAQFRCKAQLDFEEQSPVYSDILSVPVHYAPEFNNKTSHVLNVTEGADVTLNCEADGNPPPTYNWTGGGKTLGNTNNFTIVQVNASVTINCKASNYLGNVIKQIHVHVRKNNMIAPSTVMTTLEASPPKVISCPITLTPDKLVVRYGESARINCSTLDPNISGMGWEAVSGGTGITDLSFVIWEVDKLENWKPEPLCFINLNDRQCTVKANIIVYKPPDYVSVSTLVPGPMVEGKEYKLTCDIINVAPVQNLTVKWYQGSENVATFNFSNNSSSPSNVTSTWLLTAKRGDHGTIFTCKVELDLGPEGPEPVTNKTSDSYSAVVLYKPVMGACQRNYTGVEHVFRMDKLPCQADGNPAPTVQWNYQGEQINASKPLTRSQSGEYTAKIRNRLGESTISVNITVEYGPSFTCNSTYDVEENGEPQTVKCEAQGIPTPTITWMKEEKEMDSLLRWTKSDSGKYLLHATNKHGTAQHELYLNVLYAPTFKQQNERMEMKEISLGASVILECHAEGKPAPEIHWNFTSAENVFVTTRGSQTNINITEATSTNAGEYICVATNKVGNATKSFLLKIKDETSGAIKVNYWLYIILLICFITIVTIVIYSKYSKKRGQYRFTPVQRGSHIPLNDRPAGCTA